jgi:hypothetical protein
MAPSEPTTSPKRSFITRVKSRVAEFMGDPAILCLLLAMVTLSLYWPATRFQFINDDDPGNFVRNPHVQGGLSWEGLLWALGSGELSNWHPMTWLSFMFDVTLFGNSAAGPHFTNILFHAANSLLLFWLLRRLTGAHWRSAFVAGLFALHPLNVESVAWVSERKNVLSTFFWLLTLLAYARYAQWMASDRCQVTRTNSILPSVTRHPSRFYWLALLFFALGLMSKPMLVTLPFTLLLLDFWPLKRVTGDMWQVASETVEKPSTPINREQALNPQLSTLWRLALEKAPFFLLSAGACIVTFLVQQQGKAVQSFDHYPIGGRIENAFVSCCRYLGKTFWPENLTVFYPHPGHWPLAAAVPAAIFVLAACLLAFWQGRRFPFLVLGWFWFLGTLVPVIGLVQVGPQAMAERYAYVPLIGIFIIISWGTAGVFVHWRFPKTVIAIATGLVLTACAFRTRDQLGCWQNDGTIFRHVIVVLPDYYKGYLLLGNYYENQDLLNEAMDNYRATIRINPGNLAAHVKLGTILENVGRTEEAVVEFREAVRIDPHGPEVRYNLGCELIRLGRREEAIEQFTEALRLKPDFAIAEQSLQALGVSPPR